MTGGLARPARHGGLAMPMLALAGGAAVFAVLILRGLGETGGVFEYPLDDPYIHLALAEQIRSGGYGVNAGELSSPGSSALFPLLLLPFAGEPAQRFLPLFWNLVGTGITACIWGRMLWWAGYGAPGWRPLGYGAALLGPVAVLSPGVGYVGMEHTLHAAASLLVLLGLLRHLGGQGGRALVLAGVFFAAALRFEGAALGLVAAGVLFFTGARVAGLAAAALTLAPIAGFVGFLAASGLEPLPSSVQAKLADGPDLTAGPLALRVAVLRANLAQAGGVLVLALALAALALWRLAPRLRDSRWGGLAVAVALPALAHLAFGQIGWLDRYEHYILALTAAAVLVLVRLARAGDPPALPATAAVVLVIGVLLAAYQPHATLRLADYSRAILSQQGQMARFAKDFLRAPVAVNDLGLVAWRNPNYVLDLWGLASAEARDLRLNAPEPGWAGRLAAAHAVPMAMVYDAWFEGWTGPDWVKIGDFRLTRSGGYLGDYAVAFYATGPDFVAPVRRAVADWVHTLRPDTRFDWAPGMAPDAATTTREG